MTRPVFDVNVFIEHEKKITPRDYSKMALSTVVLYELTATTIDRSLWQKYTMWRSTSQKAGLLLVPTVEDWWEASKIASRLRHGEKSAAKGRTPKLISAASLQNDILIAKTVSRGKHFLVTSNTKDFNWIGRFLDLEVVSANEYFSSEG